MKAKLLKKLRREFKVVYHYSNKSYEVLSFVSHSNKFLDKEVAISQNRSNIQCYARTKYAKYGKQKRIT